MENNFLLSAGFFLVAIIYSSVGHAGASGYAAVMALLSIDPVLIRPTSLFLNIVVGVIGIYRFRKANLVNVGAIAPFLIGSIPSSYYFSTIDVPKVIFYFMLGIFLIFSAWKSIFVKEFGEKIEKEKRLRRLKAVVIGFLIGFFAGITGTGGAIFLTPVLLHGAWAKPKEIAGLSVVFVTVNSVFGLLGNQSTQLIFSQGTTFIYSLVVFSGALIGTHFGIKKWNNFQLKKAMGFVLLIAGIKLITQAFAIGF